MNKLIIQKNPTELKLVETEHGTPPKTDTKVNIWYDEGSLHLEFDCQDDTITTPYSNYNDPIFQGDVCEVFISPTGSLNEYYEIEISPNNTLFFAKITNNTTAEVDVVELLDNEIFYHAKIKDGGYEAKLQIPFSALKGFDYNKVKLNIFRIDAIKVNDDDSAQLYAYSPTRTRRFHRSTSFVDVEFA